MNGFPAGYVAQAQEAAARYELAAVQNLRLAEITLIELTWAVTFQERGGRVVIAGRDVTR